MKSIVTELAKQQIRQIAIYIGKQFGHNRRERFMQEVRQARSLLESNPNIGHVEPLLAERPIMYRSYVINHLNKIVYRINNDTIEIVAFWDVRRDPNALQFGL